MTKRLLNVGGADHDHKIPKWYDGWENRVLDLLPTADIQIDARDIKSQLHAASFDAVLCSHTLEHIERWDVARVIEGFEHVLVPGGWAEIRVPDLEAIAAKLVEVTDMDHQLYLSPSGPITIADLIYGYPLDIRDHDLMRHRNGFTFRTLSRMLRPWFKWAAVGRNEAIYELRVIAFRTKPETLPEGLE